MSGPAAVGLQVPCRRLASAPLVEVILEVVLAVVAAVGTRMDAHWDDWAGLQLPRGPDGLVTSFDL